MTASPEPCRALKTRVSPFPCSPVLWLLSSPSHMHVLQGHSPLLGPQEMAYSRTRDTVLSRTTAFLVPGLPRPPRWSAHCDKV